MLAQYHELASLHTYLEAVPFISIPPHRIYVATVSIQVAGMLEQYYQLATLHVYAGTVPSINTPPRVCWNSTIN
jgi:hypothetical protein